MVSAGDVPATFKDTFMASNQGNQGQADKTNPGAMGSPEAKASVAVAAVANKLARTIWAVLARGQAWRPQARQAAH